MIDKRFDAINKKLDLILEELQSMSGQRFADKRPSAKQTEPLRLRTVSPAAEAETTAAPKK